MFGRSCSNSLIFEKAHNSCKKFHRTLFCTFWSPKTLEHVLSCSIFIAKNAHKVIHNHIMNFFVFPFVNFFFLDRVIKKVIENLNPIKKVYFLFVFSEPSM